MPTFKVSIFQHQQRRDGKFPVSIRLTHNRQSVYIKTGTYVTRKQLTADHKTIKDVEVVRLLDRDILEYEKLLLRGLGAAVNNYTAREVADYISRHTKTAGGTEIDFIAFAWDYVSELRAAGRVGYAERFERVIRALIDYYGRPKVLIREINYANLQKIEAYLTTERTMTRINQCGKEYQITRPPLKQQSVADFMRVVQTLFNAARDKYNDEDDEALDVITHNPFRRYSVRVTEEPAKRSLSVEELNKIIQCTDMAGRCEVARDVFLLSFYFIGMNTVDLFNVEAGAIFDGRLTYKRSKTKTRRKDEAQISIRIEPEAAPLVEKYRDPSGKRLFRFHTMYADARGLNWNVNKGLKQVADAVGVNPQLSTYYARHTWATIAANDCGISDSDIGLALNHVGLDKSLKVTRGYISRDWSKIDTFNRKVLDIVKKPNEPPPCR